MTTVDLGPLTITADFDSGNFLKAELVEPKVALGRGDSSENELGQLGSTTGLGQGVNPVSSGGAVAANLHQDYEVNIWTRPDCHGTQYENGNRTWFHFAVKGGKSQGVIRINIINLNKQTKLFLQGMAPVFRVFPEKPSWERICDRIVVNEHRLTENSCSISFRHKLPKNTTKSTVYFAFTYPFSYLELCDFLKQIDSSHSQKSPPPPLINKGLKPSSVRKELWMPQAAENEIYFQRECVCYSLDGRRVELLTISSMLGISSQREERLANLFPIQNEPRPFTFPKKKVVFLSARVHPGETQSSFVLNGFIKFLLEKTDPRAVILRRLFVFKMIPMLNPDGVYRGHYRTDPRGVNLNRVYLNPSPTLHPPIYAARKLLIYYHSGLDAPDDIYVESPTQSPVKTKRKNSDKQIENVFTAVSKDSVVSEVDGGLGVMQGPKLTIKPELRTGSNSLESDKKPYTFVLSDKNSLCAGCVSLDDEVAQSCHSDSVDSQEDGLSVSASGSLGQAHQCAFEACDEDSFIYENLKVSDAVNNNMEVDQALLGVGSSTPFNSDSSAAETPRPKTGRKKKKAITKESKKKLTNKSISLAELKKGGKESSSRKSAKALPSPTEISVPRSIIDAELTRVSQFTRSNSFPVPVKGGFIKGPATTRYFDKSSGVFLYLDMHGHTTKRGIFMYGNHFPAVGTQAECMLVPRLMTINSPHFDFAACNFTERLMCVKDRRDGASREGSGRVACLKLTGLIRSYTLECNYNTGRITNPVISRPTAYGFADPVEAITYMPPKYTIELFEGVGKALAETILDMTGHNPWSRLNLTDCKSLDGLKRSLISRLKLSPEYNKSSTELMLSTKKRLPSLSYEINSLVPPTSAKGFKKLKSKVLAQTQPSGPLGLRRENQPAISSSKPSGSQAKKLPIPDSVSERSAAVAGSSKPLEKSSLPKSSLAKVMKKKSFPKFSSAVGVVKKKTKTLKKKKKNASSGEVLPK